MNTMRNSFFKNYGATAFMALTALTVMTACSSNDDEVAVAQQREIRLSSTIDGQSTRSYDAANITNQTSVWVWADQINATNDLRMDYFKAWKLTANGSGGLSSSKAKLYPATNALNFYALKGNFTTDFTEGTSELPVHDAQKELDGIIHEVKADQKAAVDFYASDLMYAQLKNRTATNGDAVLNFYHLLSRVQIVLIPGYGGTNNNLLNKSDIENAVVTILGVKNKVKFTPDTTKNIAAVDELSTNEPGRLLRAAMLSIPVTNNDPAEIVVKTEVSTDSELDDKSYGDAIVVPQTIAKGADFIKVEYMGNTTYYRIPDGQEDQPLTLESGKCYRFKLYLDRIGSTYTIQPTIDDWTAQDGGTKWVE